jgi:diaminohydroxyphosphoribosylaminopyrimidine deaminase/5-amino-6-(5-phosphoribosylamino)uracil reductase
VKKVVVSNLDSNPRVAGEGIKKLRSSGIEVITGILETEGHYLNRRFFTSIHHARPYVILKWAETADGFIARENYESKWISNDFSRQLVHKWRSEEDAILVGTRTASHDNPTLNVRNWTGRNPGRIVIDRFLRLSSKLHLFDGKQKTICYNVMRHEEHENLLLVRIGEEGFISNLLQDLSKQKIQSVMIEGGSQIINSFIDLNLWDEARVFVSPTSFEKGIAAPAMHGNLASEEFVGNDVLRFYSNQHVKS